MDKKISCDVIKDLIVLQADDLASSDSSELIKEHTQYCNECEKYLNAMKFGEIKLNTEAIEDTIKPPEKSAEKLMGKIRNLKNKYMILMILIGAIATVFLTTGKFQFKAILLCPILGILIYLLFKRVFVGPIVVFTLELIKQVIISISGIFNGDYIETTSIEDCIFYLYAGSIYALIYTLFTLIGVVIGILIEKIFFD